MVWLYLLALVVGLGLLGFVEPYSVGANVIGAVFVLLAAYVLYIATPYFDHGGD